MQLSDQELATVLSALRLWQHYLPANRESFRGHFPEGVRPLTSDEIDELCERLNCPERREP